MDRPAGARAAFLLGQEGDNGLLPGRDVVTGVSGEVVRVHRGRRLFAELDAAIHDSGRLRKQHDAGIVARLSVAASVVLEEVQAGPRVFVASGAADRPTAATADDDGVNTTPRTVL